MKPIRLRKLFLPILFAAFAAAVTRNAAAQNQATEPSTPPSAAGPAEVERATAPSTELPGAASFNQDRPSRLLPLLWYLAPVCAVVGLVMARKYYLEVKASDEGDPLMIKIAGYVREGAMAYLFRQYRVVAIVFVVLSLILSWMAYVLHVQHGLVPFAFLTGGFFSGLCGFLGMRTATIAAHRTTCGARAGLDRGLHVAFRAGAVMGLVVVGFALLDITIWFSILYYGTDMPLFEVTVVMLTFGMGASTQALFARVGGGIFTKAADVGADLVGKVEAGIPEDDPRNPATIADNVGDNVGDVAGMGADLYESYAGSILATAALGVAAAHALNNPNWGMDAIRMIVLPMVVAAAGIVASIWCGINLVKTREGASMAELMGSLNHGLLISSVAILAATYLACYFLLQYPHRVEGANWWGVGTAVVVGLAAGWLIGKFTERYTSYDFSPTKGIAEQGQTGPATVIIAGVAVGMKSTWAALSTIIVAIMLSYTFAGGGTEFMLGLYGVGLAAVGMLATLGFTLATDAYGPIADNAGGNAQMTHQAPEVRQRTDALDSLGNTTAATGKGFAIGSAALTALALLAAYVEEVRIGLVREARAYVIHAVPEAERNAEAAMGEVFYIGHGKFASKAQPGTREASFDAYMLLNEDVGELLDEKFQQGRSIVRIPALSEQKEDLNFVQSTNISDAQGKQLQLQVVSVRKAALQQFMDYYDVTLMNPKVLCGMFAGVMLVFVFCALTMQAVGRAAYRMMLECRNQFDHIRNYLMSAKGMTAEQAADTANWPMDQVEYHGQKAPDYARCVDISTRGAQREMIFPSLLAIIAPVLAGLLLGVGGVMGLLAGGLTSGFAVAIFMANAGGAWDNAKKYVEKGNFGGKGSIAHKATVVGDTVGDPFKDTSGPSLNILIKLMSMVSVVFAGLVVKYSPQISAALGLG